LEHRGISAGAKLCYIRLLGFAGKDARCYPSLETLGASLGVSDRQARDYVKELERQGLIVIEQRGLRKTNVYLFVWTAELERLMNAVPKGSADPDEIEDDSPPGSSPDRNDRSGQDRNSSSPPGRNTPRTKSPQAHWKHPVNLLRRSAVGQEDAVFGDCDPTGESDIRTRNVLCCGREF
jgi:hypothetical protein